MSAPSDQGDLVFDGQLLREAEQFLSARHEEAALNQATNMSSGISVDPFGAFQQGPPAAERLRTWSARAAADIGVVKQEVLNLGRAATGAADAVDRLREESAATAQAVNPGAVLAEGETSIANDLGRSTIEPGELSPHGDADQGGN